MVGLARLLALSSCLPLRLLLLLLLLLLYSKLALRSNHTKHFIGWRAAFLMPISAFASSTGNAVCGSRGTSTAASAASTAASSYDTASATTSSGANRSVLCIVIPRRYQTLHAYVQQHMSNMTERKAARLVAEAAKSVAWLHSGARISHGGVALESFLVCCMQCCPVKFVCVCMCVICGGALSNLWVLATCVCVCVCKGKLGWR